MHNYNFVFEKNDDGNFVKNNPFVFNLEDKQIEFINKATNLRMDIAKTPADIFFYKINHEAYKNHKNYNTIKSMAYRNTNFNIIGLKDLPEKDYCYYYISFNVMYGMILGRASPATNRDEILSTLSNNCKFILPDKIKKLLDKDKCKIILDYSKEGTGPFIQWDKFFKVTNLTPDQVIHTTGDILLGSNAYIPTTFYNYWERQVASLSFSRDKEIVPKLEELILFKKKRKWHGLCLNRVTKPHRIEICKFIDENLKHKIDYSFGIYTWDTAFEFKRNKKTDKPLDTDVLFYEWKYYIARTTARLFATMADANEYHTWLSEHNEKDSDFEPDTLFSYNMVNFYNHSSYYESYFSIVCETFYEQRGILFVSEKIFKPIAYLQPFIVIGQPYVIEYMRHIGYDVFDDIIDHSYDKILSRKHRMDKIKEEITRLCSISIDEWSNILYYIIPRLCNNYHHLTLAFYRDDKFHMPIYVNEPQYYKSIHSLEEKEKYKKLSSYSSLHSKLEAKSNDNEIFNYLSLDKDIINSYYNKNYNYDITK